MSFVRKEYCGNKYEWKTFILERNARNRFLDGWTNIYRLKWSSTNVANDGFGRYRFENKIIRTSSSSDIIDFYRTTHIKIEYACVILKRYIDKNIDVCSNSWMRKRLWLCWLGLLLQNKEWEANALLEHHVLKWASPKLMIRPKPYYQDIEDIEPK